MQDRDRLVERVEWAMRSVSNSWGYRDTAEQIVTALSDLFPGEVEAAREIQNLRAERDSEQFQAQTARMQMRAHVARFQRPATRFEVIDYRKSPEDFTDRRVFAAGNTFIHPARQDCGQALKVFISDTQLSLPIPD